MKRMGRKFYFGIILASLLAISLPSLGLAALDSSYWSTEAGAIDYDDNTIMYYVDTAPPNPWEVSWGKGQGVRENKKYVLSFDARADGKYDSLVEISIRLQKDRAPWTYYSDEKIINLDGTRRHYEIEMWSDTDDAEAMLTVWTGHEAGNYEFYDIYLEIRDGGDTPDSHPLDYSWWSVPESGINYDSGIIEHLVPSVPSDLWATQWGKDIDVREDKKYILRFDASAWSYTREEWVPIKIRIQKGYSPWTYYSEEKTIYINDEKRYYEVELYSSAYDDNAIVSVWTSAAAAEYEFSRISFEIKDDGTDPPDPPDGDSLDASWWSNIGGMDREKNLVIHEVKRKPENPWRASWGKDQAIRKYKIYVIGFWARADSYTSSEKAPISLRMYLNEAPWTRVTQEKWVDIDSTRRYYEIRLLSTAEVKKGALAVWNGHAEAKYFFSDLSLRVEDPDEIPDLNPLDSSWWSNAGGMDRGIGTVTHDVQRVPSDPSKAAWGKDQGVRHSKVYVVRFDARAESYTSDYKVPISLRFYKNSAPWTRYSSEKEIELGSEWDSYEVKLFVSASDAGAALGVYNGQAAAKYFFKKISLEIRDPHDGEIPDKNPLDPSYWSNQPDAINFGLGQITHEVETKPANPWDVAWGKDNAILNNRTYILKFDARAEDSSYEVPVKAVLYVNHDPWTRLAPEKDIKIGGDWGTYWIEFNTTGADNKAALAVWTGFSAGLYEFNNISYGLK